MHKSRQWNVFRTSILTLGLLAGASAGVHASPVINYSTSGTIDSTGVTGDARSSASTAWSRTRSMSIRRRI